MSEVVARLRELRPLLVERTVQRLTRGEELRTTAAMQIARFFELLETAVASGNPEWLNTCLQEWVNARSGPFVDERLTFLPVLCAIKTATWYVVRESFDETESLNAIVALEPSFDHAWMTLSSLEVEALLNETGRKLQSVQEELLRLERSKTNFVAVAAHELKTPLTLVDGYASMLAEESGDENSPNRFLLEGIQKGINRLREIVEDMIDVSMIDNRMMTLSFQPVRLSSLFIILHDDLKYAIGERRQDLRVATNDRQNDLIYADAKRLLQLFRIIASNAIKFTPDGGTITITDRHLPSFIEVTVADSGIGIAPENQQRIFERFMQVADVSLHSTSKIKFKGGGSGLGLAIARGIIELHGGTIWCESPGYDEQACPGSTFHIMIPKHAPNADGVYDPFDSTLSSRPDPDP